MIKFFLNKYESNDDFITIITEKLNAIGADQVDLKNSIGIGVGIGIGKAIKYSISIRLCSVVWRGVACSGLGLL